MQDMALQIIPAIAVGVVWGVLSCIATCPLLVWQDDEGNIKSSGAASSGQQGGNKDTGQEKVGLGRTMQSTFSGASLGVVPLGWLALSSSVPAFSTPQGDIFLQAESAVVGGITFSGDKVGQTERHEGVAFILFHTLLSYPCFISLHHTHVPYPCRLPLLHTTVANPCYIPAAGGGRAGACQEHDKDGEHDPTAAGSGINRATTVPPSAAAGGVSQGSPLLLERAMSC